MTKNANGTIHEPFMSILNVGEKLNFITLPGKGFIRVTAGQYYNNWRLLWAGFHQLMTCFSRCRRETFLRNFNSQGYGKRFLITIGIDATQ